MSEGLPKDWTITYTGRRFPVLYPSGDDFDIRDIAHSLAMNCRYTGHCIRFQSVAEHSWLLWDYLTRKNASWIERIWSLMHDGPEYILHDIMRPVKRKLPDFQEIEAEYEKRMAAAFNLSHPIPASVMVLDTRILLDERAQNTAKYKGMVYPPEPAGYHMCEEERDGWPDVEPLHVLLKFWKPEEAERAFLYAYWSTMQERPDDA